MQLLERDTHVETLESLLKGAVAGGAVALVAGEAGIGKTSLIQHFCGLHAKSARIFWGGCEALFTPHPLAPLHDIARQIGGDLPARISAASGRHEIFNAALTSLEQLESPAVAIIEDVHWADEATLDFIKFVGRRLQHLRLLLVISYRNDELHDRHPLRAVIGDLPPRSVKRLTLQPLSEAAVAELADSAGRDANGLYELTGGNAFFVTEVLAAFDEVPGTVRDAAIARIARLSDKARHVARLVSIVPGKAERWLVDATVAPSVADLQECLNAGMVMLADHSLAFRHELARRAVENSLQPAERRDLNAQVLAALVARGPGKVARTRLVHHADQAGDGKAVLHFASEAATQASAVGAHRGAASHLTMALQSDALVDDQQRAELLGRLSFECYMTDRIADAINARQQSLELWRKLGSQKREGESLRWMSRLSWFNGDKAAAEQYATEAVALLETLPPGPELGMAYSNRAQLYMLSREPEPAQEWGNKALALAVSLGEKDVEIHALINIGTARLGCGHAEGARDLERALRMALDGAYDEHAARAYTNLSSMYIQLRVYDAALPYLKAGIAYCEARDLDSWDSYMTAMRAQAALAQGHWDKAGRDADAVVACRASAPIIKIPALTVLGCLRARRGDPDWEEALAEAHRLSIPTGELQRLGPALVARAEAAWLYGTPTQSFLPSVAEACAITAKQGDEWMQGELAFWLWRHGRITTAPPGIAAPYRLHIEGNWRAAAEAWAAIGCPYERALALADGDEAALREALELFTQLGAAPMASVVRRKLRVRGVRRVPRGAQERTRRNPYGMTPRQLKVLEHVTQGRRNADIARLLFVSEKTVDHHVSAVLAKLGVRSRGEAAATALRLGLFNPSFSEIAVKE